MDEGEGSVIRLLHSSLRLKNAIIRQDLTRKTAKA